MVFFLSPDEKVYARYGGRCGAGPDARQSLAGLRYTMQSVLAEHASEAKRFAPTQSGQPTYLADIAPRGRRGRCVHCHQAKEMIYNQLDRTGKWSLDLEFGYPPPDNLGLKLDVDRGNVVQNVLPGSPAATAGLRNGDVISSLNGVPIHSFGDAQFALDRAPQIGQVEIIWQRSGRRNQAALDLPERWRRSDISWRTSLRNLMASARVSGTNLTKQEKQELGLSAKRLAFRQKTPVPQQASRAGIRAGDIVVGLDDKPLEMDAYKLQTYVRRYYLKGEIVAVNLIRKKKRLRLLMRFE